MINFTLFDQLPDTRDKGLKKISVHHNQTQNEVNDLLNEN